MRSSRRRRPLLLFQEPRPVAGGRDRGKFLAAILEQQRVRQLLSSEYFSVDGTLIDAWAGMKSFRRKDDIEPPGGDGRRNAEADFRGGGRRQALFASGRSPRTSEKTLERRDVFRGRELDNLIVRDAKQVERVFGQNGVQPLA